MDQNEVERAKARIEAVRSGRRNLDDYGYLSTGERITLCLGIGTKESIAALPAMYPDIAQAWRRLDEDERDFLQRLWLKG